MYHCPLPNKTKLKLVDWLKELNQVLGPNAVGWLCLWQCFDGVLCLSLCYLRSHFVGLSACECEAVVTLVPR